MTIIFCDGCCNKTTNGEGWSSIVNEKGECLITKYNDIDTSDLIIKIANLPVGTRSIIICKFNDVVSQQNNGAELLALYLSLKVALKYNFKIINCDSELLVKYWSKGITTKKTKLKMDTTKLDYINKVVELRKEFEKGGGKVVKISGDDNLADLGFHKSSLKK